MPERIDTDQDTVDFIGKVDGVGEVTLTANGIPIPLAADGEFRIRQQVPVGRSRLLLVAEDSRGGRVEQKIFVRRSAAAALTVDFGSYYALVIGNNDYRYLTDLNTAVVDAHAVAALLDEHYGFSVETLINATRYDVLSALTKMRATLMESDNLLIYYAGHGNLDVDSDEGYWLPVDAEPDNPVNWISNTTITSQLRAISAKHVLVVADSCYSGKLTRSVAASLRTGVERTAWLARMTVRRSRTALTSGGLEPVLDAGSDGHSVFARVFLDVLATNDEVLDGQSLFDAIKRPVVLNADQTPEYADVRKAGHDGGDFLFVPVNLAPLITAPPTTIMAQPDAAPSTMPVPDSGASERLFWESIKDSDDPEMFEAYLQEFPNGKFTSLVRLKRNKLEKAAKEETQTALVVPPPEPETEPGVIEMDTTFVALKTSNLRDEPTARSERVGRLKRDSPVAVTGKVKDENWYRIEYEGRTAYVYGTLIAEVDPAALDAWGGVVDTSDADEIIDFLDEYPDSIFTDRAETKLAALTTESGGATGSETQTPVVATPSTGANAAEMAFWDSIKDSDEPADYRAYLQAYPGGWFAELARVRAERPSSTQLAALPSQETEAVTRPKRSGRVINVQPIRDFRGLSKPILTDIVRNALRAVPNAVVISEQPGGDDDVVVSGSVLKFDQRQEPNPDYQAGQIAAAFFGGLAAAVTANIPPSHTLIDVEVLISAQDAATGETFSESGYANVKADSRYVNATQAGFDALQTAVIQAAKRVVIRLTGGQPQQQVTAAEIRDDANLRREIRRFYNKQKIWKTKGSKNRPTEMSEIYNISLASESGNLIKLDVRYRWQLQDMQAGKNANGIATVERSGPSFRVLDFQ